MEKQIFDLFIWVPNRHNTDRVKNKKVYIYKKKKKRFLWLNSGCCSCRLTVFCFVFPVGLCLQWETDWQQALTTRWVISDLMSFILSIFQLHCWVANYHLCNYLNIIIYYCLSEITFQCPSPKQLTLSLHNKFILTICTIQMNCR